MSDNICICSTHPETAFAELDTAWTSENGKWRVTAKVESVDSLPKYKVRTVSIYRQSNGEYFKLTKIQGGMKIPDYVMDVYEKFNELVKEV